MAAHTKVHKLYLQGKSIKEISEASHWSEKTVSNLISHGVTNAYPLNLISDLDKECIKNKYLNGLGIGAIGKEYEMSHHKISDILEELGIDRKHQTNRKYKLDVEYFDHIDTPNKAYILGFLFADGYNSLEKGTISMSLRIDDKYILEEIKDELKSEHPLEYIKGKKFKDGDKEYISSDQFRLIVHSSYMCESLICCGMIPNKSNRLKFPMYIPDELISHFVRGYFDGDGSMGFHDLSTWNNKNLIIKIVGTKEFNIYLSKYLKEKLNIDSLVKDASNNNGITTNLCINKISSQKKFCEWMYNDAEMFLKRKHDVYVAWENINNPDLNNEQIG